MRISSNSRFLKEYPRHALTDWHLKPPHARAARAPAPRAAVERRLREHLVTTAYPVLNQELLVHEPQRRRLGVVLIFSCSSNRG